MRLKLVKGARDDEYEVVMVNDAPRDPVSREEKILYMIVIFLGVLFGIGYFAAIGLARVLGM